MYQKELEDMINVFSVVETSWWDLDAYLQSMDGVGFMAEMKDQAAFLHSKNKDGSKLTKIG